MILAIGLLVTISLLSHTEWETLRERLEELGEGDSKAVAAAMEILTRQADAMDIPHPTATQPPVKPKIKNHIEALSTTLATHLGIPQEDDHLINLVNIEMELATLGQQELNEITDIIHSKESNIDINAILQKQETEATASASDDTVDVDLLQNIINSKVDLSDPSSILSNGLVLDLTDIDFEGMISKDSLKTIENTVKDLLMKSLNMDNLDIDSYMDDYPDDIPYEDMTDEEIAAADAAAGIKAGEGELHFGPDSLRFEWTMGIEGWEELSEFEQKIWNSLDELTVEQIPEGRRMFEGHEPLFFDPAQSEDSYRKRGRKFIQRTIASELRRQNRRFIEYPVISTYINGSYKGTNRKGKYTSQTLNYTGAVNGDLQPDGVGVQQTNDLLYRGQFLNGSRHGEGTAQYKADPSCTYSGGWSNDNPNGVGSLSCSCGSYTGHWHLGTPDPHLPNTTIVDSSSGCNITWNTLNESSTILEPITFCNGSKLQKTTINNDTFTGSILPRVHFSMTKCPILTVLPPAPYGHCIIRNTHFTYDGDCNDAIATGRGTITSPSLGMKLNVTVNDSVVSGEVSGTIRGMAFSGTVRPTHLNNLSDLSGEGIFVNGSVTYTGGMRKGYPHGRIIAEVANHGSFYGMFVKGQPHGLITHELPSSLRETANYRYGVRHGVTRVYSHGVLSRVVKYHFGTVLETEEVTSPYFLGVTWEFASNFMAYGFFHVAGWFLIRRLLPFVR
eukprot:TRINITY_DN2058_c3_g1_i1.p1 TRINITY_DN2058_c3_g1~~TRINITY_DN2058_c3_g1_i1.p1  ORF type:complete len:763 (+),score=115.64 TRINITY_DN2058_c3_g1_i1:101-2290(+)